MHIFDSYFRKYSHIELLSLLDHCIRILSMILSKMWGVERRYCVIWRQNIYEILPMSSKFAHSPRCFQEIWRGLQNFNASRTSYTSMERNQLKNSNDSKIFLTKAHNTGHPPKITQTPMACNQEFSVPQLERYGMFWSESCLPVPHKTFINL